MSKVMLVEDDDSLREIYSIRLTAEGYTIVTARDGEEALAVAVKERPDLIISDVMMPKISGFDMLDILRSTPETQNIKVIMMTALSSEDERQRGENLGADRYLVKSQVGIEDVVNAVHEVLGDQSANGVINTSTPVNDPATGQQPSAIVLPSEPSMAAMPVSATTSEIAAAPVVPTAMPVTPASVPSLTNPVPTENPPVTAVAASGAVSAPTTTSVQAEPNTAPMSPQMQSPAVAVAATPEVVATVSAVTPEATPLSSAAATAPIIPSSNPVPSGSLPAGQPAQQSQPVPAVQAVSGVETSMVPSTPATPMA